MKHELYVTTTVSGALRNKWEFEYSTQELQLAAEKQAMDRRGRRDRWRMKYDEVMALIKASGLSVHESLASSVSNRTYGQGPTINVDSKLQQDLLEAHSRIEIHDRAAEEYLAWSRVMRATTKVLCDHVRRVLGE